MAAVQDRFPIPVLQIFNLVKSAITFYRVGVGMLFICHKKFSISVARMSSPIFLGQYISILVIAGLVAAI